jgi:outer membrane usher protein FimD/PapC
LLTNFVPFTANRVGIDPRDYDLGTTINITEKTIVPPRQSGVIVDLTPEKHQSALIVLRNPAGEVLPLGTRVTLDDGGGPIAVGWHGETYINDLHKAVNGLAQIEGGVCHFAVAAPEFSKNDPIPRIDPVTCAVGQML